MRQVTLTEKDRGLIEDMLRRYRDAQETMLRSGEGTGGEGSPWQMPETWTREMRELERCLGLLARSKPKVHRHLMARYVDPLVSRRRMPGRVERKQGGDVLRWPQLGPNAEVRSFAKLPESKGTSEYSCLVASWPSWVLKPVCEVGVGWIMREYRVEPGLPVAFLEQAA